MLSIVTLPDTGKRFFLADNQLHHGVTVRQRADRQQAECHDKRHEQSQQSPFHIVFCCHAFVLLSSSEDRNTGSRAGVASPL